MVTQKNIFFPEHLLLSPALLTWPLRIKYSSPWEAPESLEDIQIITMTYLNRFHKESVERCLRKVAESKSLQMNCEEEVRKIKEMHNQIAKRYPKEA